ncbi:MAG: hydroxyacid dehydrogenase [Candidatus Doudnabacteria bacterium]|nr:hydroxyacid dehydrogenase [Candidatus Doudnabacteria bacterium]
MKVCFVESDAWTESRVRAHGGMFTVVFVESAAESAVIPADTEVLSVFVNSKVTATVMDSLPQLKLIVTRSTGYDHIDLAAAATRGIAVCNVPSYGERTVAEYAFALLLTLSRKMYTALKRVHDEGVFHTDGLTGFDLAEKTIGVVGTGRIGCHVIEIASGFGMHVIAYDPFPRDGLEKQMNMQYVSLDELLKRADVITLHAPYLPSTHHLLNAQNMPLIKQGAVLVNTARGGLVETQALVDALAGGVLAGAALDVLEEERYVGAEQTLLKGGSPAEQMKAVLADHQLMSYPNVLVSPHNAFNTIEARERILDTTLKNIAQFAASAPQNVVK